MTTIELLAIVVIAYLIVGMFILWEAEKKPPQHRHS